ncbi:UTP15 C terminal-domain-containing protein [Syncephalis pseudoplumigaleata]|uniref:UTP15 C terminal-domain-containing protein n=1 Tax=Syncephalis pseudoplumigaleata TaxID=1712513 RepID=A0A4P9YTF6_9FUNG|nr:UTP15 C terminal-domain-containing protein [Syncephalis pseudoplumigaleata]|eukprot:RKP23197.1 UTP15 C terminal-domain-containing protein [Syncephalis pseudoplumigaleata]
MLSLRHRRQMTAEQVYRVKNEETLRRSTYDFRSHGGTAHEGTQDDFVVEGRRVKRLALYDKHLRAFQYGSALDAVLSGKYEPVTVVSLLQELIHRGALRTAVSRRDDVALEPLLKFITKYIRQPRYASTLTLVAEMVLDIYEAVLAESSLMAKLLHKLHAIIHMEVRQQQELTCVMGALEMVLSMSMLSNAASHRESMTAAAQEDAVEPSPAVMKTNA